MKDSLEELDHIRGSIDSRITSLSRYTDQKNVPQEITNLGVLKAKLDWLGVLMLNERRETREQLRRFTPRMD
jgi:hypothetical protein